MSFGSLPSACFCLMLIVQGANGNAFLKAETTNSERMSETEIQTSLLAEVEGGLGTSAGFKVVEFEGMLLPIFNALPKNEYGRLGHSTVRYALHRAFVQRHGWFIRGLDRAGESWNGTSPAGVLKDQVPAYVQSLFESRLDGKGFGLHEVAVLAAAIEHLVHNEALGKLGTAYNIHEQIPTSDLKQADAYEVLETYMMSYILGDAMTKKTLRVVKRLKEKMDKIYLAWPETQVFIREIIEAVSHGSDTINFAKVARIAERMGEKFGAFQAKECSLLKTALVKVEDRGTGRIRLHDFYKPAFGGQDGSWQFQESIPYLRQLGALDESVPEDAKVILSNYLGSQANCIASSSFYAVCCMDECEPLLTHLEKNIKVAEAPAARIAALVSELPSATVSTPRELSSTLRRRLDEIAETNGGSIPLHGRLFSQWMHHAYPRECPYPHVAGTTAPMAALAWKEESGLDHTASTEDIERVVQESQVRNATSSTATDEELSQLMPWSEEEELLVVRKIAETATTGSSVPESLRYAALAAAAVSMAVGLVRNFKSGPKLSEEACQKFYV